MENNMVGYRFGPTGAELINHYLKKKILGQSCLVDHAISQVNIYDYEPERLPSLSKLKSKDQLWYFFCRKEFTSAKKKAMKRATRFGFWKATGVDRKIKDMRSAEIGIKKTLVYYKGRTPNGVKTPWVMHEHHITSLPPTQRTYVICKVMYKGDDGDNLYCNISIEPSHSMVSVSNTTGAINTLPEVEQQGQEDGVSVSDWLIPLNQQEDLFPCDGFNQNTFSRDNNSYNPQTPCDDDYLNLDGWNFDLELKFQENCNDHMPSKPLTGTIFDDDSSDSDAESNATSYQGTSSPGDSDCRVDKTPLLRKDYCKDIKTSTPMVKSEKKGWFVTKKATDIRNRKNAPYMYLVNVIISNIISVLLCLKD